MRRITQNQRGDTIVEVLISIAVVSLVLSGAYASANRNTRSLQDTQERGQALQLAQRQLEFLKATGGDSFKVGGANAGGCFGSDGGATIASATCLVQPSGDPIPDASFQPAYTIVVAQASPDPAPLTVKVTWVSLVNGGVGDLEMYYRP